MQPLISGLLAAALVLAPQFAAAPSVALAQPAKLQPPAKPTSTAKAAATRNIACPATIAATVGIPTGFARYDNNGPGLKLIGMRVDGGQMSCQYGSVYLTMPAAKNCTRGPGAWDQQGNCFFPPPGTWFGSDPTCYATCE